MSYIILFLKNLCSNTKKHEHAGYYPVLLMDYRALDVRGSPSGDTIDLRPLNVRTSLSRAFLSIQ